MASTDARPVPQKGVAYRVTFPLLDADGDLVTGASSLDSEVSKDGDTFADCTNEATEIATSSGMYFLDLTSSEMDADCVAVIIKSASAKTTAIVLYPEEGGDIRVNVTQAAGTAWNSGAIGAATLASDTIAAAKIAAGAITSAKFAAGAIDATAIADNAIDAGAIAAGAITSAKFAAGAIDAAAIAANAIGASELAADAANEIADAILDRDMSTGTDSGSATVRTMRQALYFLRNKWSISGTTLTVTKPDDTTTSWTSEVTATAGADPITANDPASS